MIVSGRVQGVWFRDSCRLLALEHALAGWARNCLDGTVEAVFEGPAPDVAQLVAWCRIGPPRADVSGIEVFEEPPESLVGFHIR